MVSGGKIGSAYVPNSDIDAPGEANIRSRPTAYLKQSLSFYTGMHPFFDSMHSMDVDIAPANGSITIPFSGAQMSITYSKRPLFFPHDGSHSCTLDLLALVRRT